MRSRLAVGLAAAVALVAMGTAGHAATPTLDGKKIKKIEFKGSAGLEANDTGQATFLLVDSPEPANCKAPAECARQDFKFKPAKGKKGDLVVKITFGGSPITDMDLYIVNSKGEDVSHCGNAYGTGEFTSILEKDLKSGETYTAIVVYYRSIPSATFTGTIEFPSKAPARGPNSAFIPVEDEIYGGHLVTCG